MSKKLLLNVLFVLFVLFVLDGSLNAQTSSKSKPLPPGYPDRSSTLDVYPGFKNPPAGYGEVSFYWWLGDTLTRERITWQLDQLEGKSITGLQVNYAHSDEGGNIWGLTYPGQPRLFSKDWWDLFVWFLQEAKKRNMSVSLSDYTLGIAGQGWFVDEMLGENPGLHGSRLVSRRYDIRAGLDTLVELPADLLNAVVYRIENASVIPGSGYRDIPVSGNKLHIQPANGDRRLILVYPETVLTSFDPMNPLSGKKVIEKFFQPFEEHCPGEAGKGLNFFFSDELNFGISGLLWNSRFASEFRKRKGYDIIPELAALFMDVGSATPKIRIDFNDVLVALSEESFFIPLYKWHTDRGMLFGCDHGGRGLDVTEFGDYFRTQRWMSGPGCDQPNLDRNINKNKVASSIAHLYERPRTWLEGYHSSGWGTSSARVAEATFANFAMGQNLLSLHGLYYSTHGGWWEWAPPDNHFRQPYWADMGDFLKCSERLSYLLSQGHHRCDVAILYPVTPVVAGSNGNEAVSLAFAAGEKMYKSGIDYDFMDFESLARAKIKGGELQISGESYQVLILPAMTTIRHQSLKKALDFYQAGGIVIALGALPIASERIGSGDPEIQAANRKIFGISAGETSDKTRIVNTAGPGKGTGIYLVNAEGIEKTVGAVIVPDFKVLSAGITPYFQHRRIGTRDIYYVYGVPEDSVCYFRCRGRVELWDAWTGNKQPLPAVYADNAGTRLKMPAGISEPRIIVFEPGDPVFAPEEGSVTPRGEILLVGEWEFELKPTLDNRYGDYRQPAYEGFVATDAQVIRFRKETNPDPGWQATGTNDDDWQLVQVSYGPEFWRLGPLPGGIDSLALESGLSGLTSVNPVVPVVVAGKEYFWSAYEFSWRWGLRDNPGRQGYHGLKEWIHDDIFQFGQAVRDWPGAPSPRIVAGPEGSTWYLWSSVLSGRDQKAGILKGGIQPSGTWVNGNQLEAEMGEVSLRQGPNPVLIRYSAPGTGYLVFENMERNTGWKQTIPLASGWYGNPDVLPYDPEPGSSGQAGWYRFKAPPGLQSIELATPAMPQVWVNGREATVRSHHPVKGLLADPSQKFWKAEPAAPVSASSSVAIRVIMQAGSYGGAAFTEPIRLNCGKGMIRAGDLSEYEGLKTYSGGMWYRKTISMTPEQSRSQEISLDLGDLVSSAEVFVNSKSAGKRLSPPWVFDLKGKIKPGDNRLEILIYNTLANYYLTTPSRYVGPVKSGLVGPVRLLLR